MKRVLRFTLKVQLLCENAKKRSKNTNCGVFIFLILQLNWLLWITEKQARPHKTQPAQGGPAQAPAQRHSTARRDKRLRWRLPHPCPSLDLTDIKFKSCNPKKHIETTQGNRYKPTSTVLGSCTSTQPCNLQPTSQSTVRAGGMERTPQLRSGFPQ